MAELQAADIRGALERLHDSNSATFGRENHRFLLNPILTESDIVAFEHQYNIRMPTDYRHFLTTIGNGGAGPYYGVFPLGEVDESDGVLQRWHECDHIVGDLSQPFPFDAAWNDLSDMPSDELLKSDEIEYWRRTGKFEKVYWDSSLVNGAIPICHEGCAIRIWLVVTGSQAGYLWRDGRSEYTGIKPVQSADGRTATFSIWYAEWLQHAIEGSPNNPR